MGLPQLQHYDDPCESLVRIKQNTLIWSNACISNVEADSSAWSQNFRRLLKYCAVSYFYDLRRVNSQKPSRASSCGNPSSRYASQYHLHSHRSEGYRTLLGEHLDRSIKDTQTFRHCCPQASLQLFEFKPSQSIKMAPQGEIPLAANVLGTIGTICWCVQLVP